MRPTRRCLGVFAGGLLFAALPTLFGAADLWWAWLAAIVVFTIVLAVELALLPTPGQVQLSVQAPLVLHFGDAAALVVAAASARVIDAEVHVEIEGACEPLPPALLQVRGGEPARAELPLRPSRRGPLRLVACHARWVGPLGLLWCEVQQPLTERIRVVTNVRAVRQRAARMVENREFSTGLKVERFLGEGSDFDSLREFVMGMDRRAIDWKATARHREVLCRDFRAERDHAVMLCVDAGRLMGEPLAGMPRLDHAILAALQLAFVCLRTGDRVGLYSFADQPQKALVPQAGVHALAAIQERLAGLEYSDAETNFTLAMTDLLQRLRRRTLVVLFTDFVDSVTAELMLRNVGWLARRHLLLFVAMRDPLLATLAAHEPATIEDVHRAVVAEEIHRERLLVLERIRAAGAQVLDTEVGSLDAGLIQRYLQMKRRELL